MMASKGFVNESISSSAIIDQRMSLNSVMIITQKTGNNLMFPIH